MRVASDRLRAIIAGGVARWQTVAQWSNDGGQTWTDAELVAGSVTVSQVDQVRWRARLTLRAPLGLAGINAFSTQLRLRHGVVGEPLLEFGRYKVTATTGRELLGSTIEVTAASHEVYVMGARFVRPRTILGSSASDMTAKLLQEVIPGAALVWEMGEDPNLPTVYAARDRWPLLDGDRDAPSIARSIGGRLRTGPSGQWIMAPVPSLDGAAVWTAKPGEALLEAVETLTDDGVYNAISVKGEDLTEFVATGSGDDPDENRRVTLFRPVVLVDNDPDSPTYWYKPVTQGGFGQRPRFYTSQLIRTQGQAQTAARGMLAPALGLRQQISFSTLHNPLLEPGDVGVVDTADGPRRVLPDAFTFDLLGGPTTGDTRTTSTRLTGGARITEETTGDLT